MEVWVGTSGYSYADWIGAFYPPGTPAKRMLAHYARVFPITELNFSFYGVPTPETLAQQVKQTPPGFQFAVKLYQGFTHDRDLSEVAAFHRAMQVLEQEGRLCALLAQFPQAFHHDKDSLGFLESLASCFAGYPLAVEFRHSSWAAPSVSDWLRERGLHLVSVDVPPISGLFPPGLVMSTHLIYIRLHSRRRDMWYEGDKQRYDYLYSDAEMTEWIEALRGSRGQADRAYVFFNNCHDAQAVINAQRMQELLQGQADLKLIPPAESLPPAEEQGMLF